MCEWGLRLVFRPENIETLPASHPSLQQIEKGSSQNVQVKRRRSCSPLLITITPPD